MDVETKRMGKNGKPLKFKIKDDDDALTYDDVKRAKRIKDKYEHKGLIDLDSVPGEAVKAFKDQWNKEFKSGPKYWPKDKIKDLNSVKPYKEDDEDGL